MIMILNAMITILIRERRSRKSSLRAPTALLVAAVLAALLSGCGGSPDTTDPGVKVVATTSIWGDIARQIVGEDGEVEVLLPIGADAHDYQASSRQVASLGTADLVIANGLGLEERLHDVLESIADDGGNVLEVGDQLDPIPFATSGEDGADERVGLDPHVWFDLVRVADGARLIAGELELIDDTIDWSARAEELAADLVAADREIETILADIPTESRKLVTNHEALGYFAARYDFEVIGAVIPGGSTLIDPSSAELAELVGLITQEEIHAIFAETSLPSQLAEAVAAEVGEDIAVVELFTESLGEPGSEAETLIEMQLANARLIAEALS
jgi:zinc/manganese transport system substrate-binding protein